MMVFRAVFKFGASSDSNTTTPPSLLVSSRSWILSKSLPNEATLDPILISAVGI